MFKQRRTFLAALAALLLTTSISLAETLTVNDIGAGIPGVFALNISSLEIVNGNVTEAQVRALFETGVADKNGILESLEAESITVSNWSWSFTLPEGQTIIEGEVAGEGSTLSFTAIKGGVVGTVVDAGQTITYPEGGNLISNRLELSDVDLPRLLGFFGLTSRPAEATLQQIYSQLSYDGYTAKSMLEECNLLNLTTGAIKLRPFKMPLIDVIAVQRKISSHTPVDSHALSMFYSDVLTGFELGPWAMSDHNCNTIVEGKAVQFSAENLRGEGFANGVMKATAVDNFEYNVDEDYVMTASKFKLEDVDFSGVASVFSDVLVMVDDEWIAANLRKFAVQFSGLSAENVAFDFPDNTNPANRIHFDIAKIDLTLGEYRNAIPTDIRFVMTGVKLPVSESAEYQAFRNFGMEEVEASYLMDLNWNEADSTIIVDGLSMSIKELGSIALSGTIGHASAALFSNNMSTAILAATSLTALDATLDFIDDGFNDKILKYLGGVEGKSVEELRESYVSTIEMTLPTLLGDNPGTTELLTALAKYRNGHPNLILTAKSNDPAGITLPELMAAERNPLSLLSKVTLGASNPGDMDDGEEAGAKTSP